MPANHMSMPVHPGEGPWEEVVSVVASALPRQRWFAGKDRPIASVDLVPAGQGPGPVSTLLVAEVRCVDGSPIQRYVCPVALAPIGAAAVAGHEGAVFGYLADGRAVVDALHDPALALDLARSAGVPEGPSTADVTVLEGEQSNTSIRIGDGHLLKVFRRLAPGPSPEIEIGAHLSALAFPFAPRLVGQLCLASGEAIAVLHKFVPGARDAWMVATEDPEADVARLAEHLGQATGALHQALAQPTADEAFAPEPVDDAYLSGLVEEVARTVESVTGRPAPTLTPPGADGVRTRGHGDLHLGQVLWTGDTALLIDFEGEPARPTEARRAKHLPERDLAGVLRSWHYAAATRGEPDPAAWADRQSARFLNGYGRPVDAAALHLFLLEKACYEVAYEQAHRPSWAAIPLADLETLLAAEAG